MADGMSSRSLFPQSACLILLLLAGSIGGASADDEKSFPGTYCRPTFETTHLFGIGGGPSIYNKSTTDFLHVICPIIRDEMANYYPELAWVEVDYQNAAHPATRLYCTLEKRSPHGGTLRQSKLETSPSWGSPGARILHVEFDSTPYYRPGLFYQIRCTLPPSVALTDNKYTKIWGYRIREDD